MAKTWYKKGNEGIEESKRQDAQAKARSEQKDNRRFWQNKDETSKIIIIDNPVFFFNEHSIEMGGIFRNFFTCLSDFDDCALCLNGDRMRYSVVVTIIDTREYVAKNGNEYKNQKKLLVCIGECRKNILKELAAQKNDIAYSVYELSRGGLQGEPSTGSSFKLLKKSSRGQIAKWLAKQWKAEGKEFTSADMEKFLAPFDYQKVFAPKSAEELRKIAGMGEAISSIEQNVSESSEDIESDEEPESIDAFL